MPTWWQAVTPTSSIPMAHRLQRRRWHSVEERLDTPQEVEVVVEESGRRLGGEAVGELECADAGLDPIRRQDLGRDGCVVSAGLHAVAHRGCRLLVSSESQPDLSGPGP